MFTLFMVLPECTGFGEGKLTMRPIPSQNVKVSFKCDFIKSHVDTKNV